MSTYRATRRLAACLLPVLLLFAAGPVVAQPTAPPGGSHPVAAPRAAPVRTQAPSGGTIADIQVEGNQRIEAGTIRSYLLVRPGDAFDPDRIDRSLKTLYATGLFQDVRLGRQGDTLVVRVVENPIVNRVAFEGNHKLTDAQLRTDLQLRPRAVFTSALAEADRQHILTLYAHHGYYDASVDPKIIRLPENRVDVVFQISDGSETLISKIVINGNKAFSEDRLTEVISSRESRWWRFLSSSDEFEPERLAYDKELLRRFYLKNGYADIEVTDASAELSPDRKGFFLSFTVSEGERYRVGKVSISSQLRNLDPNSLQDLLQLSAGDWYDGDAVGRTADALEEAVHNKGYAFVEVKPRVDRDPVKHIINLTFDIGEGPRVYVERINIVGNQRTEDKVIRREFRLAEGDPYSAEAVRRTKSRLTDLGYFQTVDINTTPGSAPDKAILTTNITEKATGELSFGGGYSTDAGALLDIGLSERNLVGTGIAASINGVLAQKRSSVNASITDPYFLDRNLVAGVDAFLIQTNFLGTEPYDERRAGFALRMGYDFNEHLRQVWSYSLVNRDVYDIESDASPFIINEAGTTVLSQISQVLTLDYRDSRLFPHKGYVVEWGTDFAGLGGDARFVRNNLTGAYYIPLDRLFNNDAWGIKLSGSVGYMNLLSGGREEIIDRFFLGGDNLRGFETGGAGPHDAITGDPLGGRFLWTQSTELRYPLPVSPDLGLTGRAFVDVGALTEANFRNTSECSANGVKCEIAASSAPRVGAGVGISWRTAFGLINVDLTPFVIKQSHDQTQIFRFGFGTRF
ncbi:MAG TPA: outer membrane protein assembly factor BamA [Rhodopila sp.]|uniref:outer membrane protein assembly factor BamA n=1 Tax=Rhodopila sp. TaxID=2480087 RepID=UPI002C6124D5|nr:outer membrane protein assembly factor BamA [Rhodopila sp.]HVY18322.1 outer membrane protein assembly factor BamA [Rhodopila sp.]